MNNDRHTRESDERLPPELRRLHEELSSIHIEERASFGPELRAELERIWAEEPDEETREPAVRRTPALLAALLGGLIVVSMAAPQARAAFGDLFLTVQSEVQTLLEEPEDPGVPEVVMDRPEMEAEAPVNRPPARRAARNAGPATTAVVGSGSNAFPDIADREQARTVIEVFYPDDLQSRGVGGTVGLTLRVTEDGTVDGVRLLESSGVPELDEAALDAAQLLDFRPAVRDGVPTATWVRFGVEFRPPTPAVEGEGAGPTGR